MTSPTLPSKQNALSTLLEAVDSTSNISKKGASSTKPTNLKHALMADNNNNKGTTGVTDLKDAATTNAKGNSNSIDDKTVTIEISSSGSAVVPDQQEEEPPQKTKLPVSHQNEETAGEPATKKEESSSSLSLSESKSNNDSSKTTSTTTTSTITAAYNEERSQDSKNLIDDQQENKNSTTPTTTKNDEATKSDNKEKDGDQQQEEKEEQGTSGSTSTSTSSTITKPKPILPSFLMATPSLSFAEMLMTALVDPKNNDIMTFLPDKTTFGILKLKAFAKELMTNYFGISTLSSFVRKLKRWGFVRVGDRKTFDMAFYRHPVFKQGDWSTCSKIKSSGRYTKLASYEESVQTESIMLQTTSFMQAVANAAAAKNAAANGTTNNTSVQQEEPALSLPQTNSNYNKKRNVVEVDSLSPSANEKAKKLKTSTSMSAATETKRRTSNPTDCLVPAYVESQQRRFSETSETRRLLNKAAAAQRRHSADTTAPEPRLSEFQEQRQQQQQQQQQHRRLSGMQGQQQQIMVAQRRLSEVQRRLSADSQNHDHHMMTQRRLSEVQRRVSVDSQQQLEHHMMAQRRLSELERRMSADSQQHMMTQQRRLSEAHRRLSADSQHHNHSSRSISDEIFMAASKSLLQNAAATESPAITEEALISDMVLHAAAAKAERRMSGAVSSAVQHHQALQQQIEADMVLRAVAERRMSGGGHHHSQQRRLSDVALQAAMERRMSGAAAFIPEVASMQQVGTAERRLSAEHQLALKMELEKQQNQRRLSHLGSMPDAASKRAALLASGLLSSQFGPTAEASALAAAAAKNSSSVDLSLPSSHHHRLSLGMESASHANCSESPNLDDRHVHSMTKSIVGDALAILHRDGQIQPKESLPTIQNDNMDAFAHKNNTLLQARMNLLNASSSQMSNMMQPSSSANMHNRFLG